jgi:hypothetical protein
MAVAPLYTTSNLPGARSPPPASQAPYRDLQSLRETDECVRQYQVFQRGRLRTTDQIAQEGTGLRCRDQAKERTRQRFHRVALARPKEMALAAMPHIPPAALRAFVRHSSYEFLRYFATTYFPNFKPDYSLVQTICFTMWRIGPVASLQQIVAAIMDQFGWYVIEWAPDRWFMCAEGCCCAYVGRLRGAGVSGPST